MDDVVFERVRLEPDVEYFLYVGEIKAHCLSGYVAEGLARRFGRPFAGVCVCPDVLADYPPGNILAVNPWLAERPGVAERRPMDQAAAWLSASPRVLALVEELLSRQGRLFVWMFESKAELALTALPGVMLLGPDPELVRRLNDKTWQYEALGAVAPMVDFDVCAGREAMLAACERMREVCGHGVFVSCDYSAGGVSSQVVRTTDEAACRFADEGRYLVSRYVPHVCDPTVLGVVGGPDEVFVAGVADMRIEDGNKFRGSTFPSTLSPSIQATLREHTAAVGRAIGALGFRGIFGCDFIVDEDGGVYFIEVNPRKQGTTMEFCCTMEHLLPPGAPNLPELEIAAVLDGRFPEGWAQPDHDRAPGLGLHWGTYNHKIETPGKRTVRALPQAEDERALFARVAGGGAGGHVILEHVGADVAVMPGTFLGRVAAVGATRERMQEALERGREELAASVMDDA